MTTKTFRLSGHAIERQWHVLDAEGRPLGRVASEAAQLLLGKHKTTYEPHLAMGDHVIVINASKVDLTGNKRQQKIYYRHTGYPGGLRERTFDEQMERDPRRVIERAVKGMLPHNSRGRQLFRALKVYAGPDHPHEAKLKAGTGARAQKRARAAQAQPAAPAVAEAPTPAAAEVPPVETPEVETPVAEAPVAEAPVAEAPVAEAPVAEAPATEAVDAPETASADSETELRLTGSLQRYKRDELDAEATRLSIEIEPGWNKGDVADAIQQHYEAHPVEE
jgi:large subunit ribosomal protein L13